MLPSSFNFKITNCTCTYAIVGGAEFLKICKLSLPICLTLSYKHVIKIFLITSGLTSINFTENSDGSDAEILQLGHPVEK